MAAEVFMWYYSNIPDVIEQENFEAYDKVYHQHENQYSTIILPVFYCKNKEILKKVLE